MEIILSFDKGPGWIDALQTIGSVLLGGILSYFTTSYFQRTEKRDDARDRANALVWKILTIANDVLATSKQLRSGFLESDTDDPHFRPWTIFPELAGISEDIITIEAKDLQVVLHENQSELASRIVDLNNNRTVLNKSLIELFRRRSMLSEKMNSVAVSSVDRRVTYNATKEQMLPFSKDLIEIETFTNSILEMIPFCTNLAVSVSKHLNDLIRENYTGKKYLIVEIPKVDGILTHGDVIMLIAGKKIG